MYIGFYQPFYVNSHSTVILIDDAFTDVLSCGQNRRMQSLRRTCRCGPTVGQSFGLVGWSNMNARRRVHGANPLNQRGAVQAFIKQENIGFKAFTNTQPLGGLAFSVDNGGARLRWLLLLLLYSSTRLQRCGFTLYMPCLRVLLLLRCFVPYCNCTKLHCA